MTASPVFIGFESLGQHEASPSSHIQGSALNVEVERLLGRLESAGISSSSLLSIDVFAAPATGTGGVGGAELVAALGALLPADARPVVSVIPTKRLPGGSTVCLQAVAIPGEAPSSAGTGRFPGSAIAGSYFAVASQPNAADVGIVEQSKTGLSWLSEQIEQLGGTVTDVLRLNVFYVGGGTRDDWAESARIRAAHFPEPGPCATGIPVERLAEPHAAIVFQALGIAGARADGRIIGAWPKGHWDWPFHLPYRHGNLADGVCFLGGQVSLATDSSVIDPGNLAEQTTTAVRNIESILAELGGSLNDVVRLTAFFENRLDADEDTVRRQVQSAMPNVQFDLSLVGMDKLAYPDMLVEIECQAVLGR